MIVREAKRLTRGLRVARDAGAAAAVGWRQCRRGVVRHRVEGDVADADADGGGELTQLEGRAAVPAGGGGDKRRRGEAEPPRRVEGRDHLEGGRRLHHEEVVGGREGGGGERRAPHRLQHARDRRRARLLAAVAPSARLASPTRAPVRGVDFGGGGGGGRRWRGDGRELGSVQERRVEGGRLECSGRHDEERRGELRARGHAGVRARRGETRR